MIVAMNGRPIELCEQVLFSAFWMFDSYINLPLSTSMIQLLTKTVMFNSLGASSSRCTRHWAASVNVPTNFSRIVLWKLGWIRRRWKFQSSTVNNNNNHPHQYDNNFIEHMRLCQTYRCWWSNRCPENCAAICKRIFFRYVFWMKAPFADRLVPESQRMERSAPRRAPVCRTEHMLGPHGSSKLKQTKHILYRTICELCEERKKLAVREIHRWYMNDVDHMC